MKTCELFSLIEDGTFRFIDDFTSQQACVQIIFSPLPVKWMSPYFNKFDTTFTFLSPYLVLWTEQIHSLSDSLWFFFFFTSYIILSTSYPQNISLNFSPISFSINFFLFIRW
ncbi:MAG: hypothetical protein QXW48_04680, partial [Thermoplasmata archaeon]